MNKFEVGDLGDLENRILIVTDWYFREGRLYKKKFLIIYLDLVEEL